MKCYYHPDRDAVATCQVCGRALCPDCASKYHPCLCDDCYAQQRQEELENLKHERRSLIKAMIVGLIISFASCVAIVNSNDFLLAEDWWIPIFAFFIPYGWRYSNLFQIAYSISLGGLLLFMLYNTFRAFLATIIGVPCFFVSLIKLILVSKAAKTTEIEALMVKTEQAN